MNNEAGLERCRHLIEASLNWGDPASWTNEDFEELSDRIFEKTEVRLSVSTFKRIWGKVKYEHSPTTATLNALARYAGFESWRAFISQAPPKVETVSTPPPPARRRRILAPIVISTVAVAGLLALLSARLIHVPMATANAPVRFESRRTSDEL